MPNNTAEVQMKPVSELSEGVKFIVIQCQAWCNDAGSGLYYSSDLEELEGSD